MTNRQAQHDGKTELSTLWTVAVSVGWTIECHGSNIMRWTERHNFHMKLANAHSALKVPIFNIFIDYPKIHNTSMKSKRPYSDINRQ